MRGSQAKQQLYRELHAWVKQGQDLLNRYDSTHHKQVMDAGAALRADEISATDYQRAAKTTAECLGPWLRQELGKYFGSHAAVVRERVPKPEARDPFV